MKHTKHYITLVATAAVILCGCASPATHQSARWTHPEGRTADQIERDLAECRVIGHQQGGFHGGNAAWYMATRKGSISDDVVRDCMIAKGYKPASK